MQRSDALFCVKSMLAVIAASAILTPHAGAAINSGSNWTWQNPLPQGFTLNAISCFTTTNCIAVGDNGTIIATTNGGTTWVGGLSVTTQTLRAISCANTTNCTAVGDQGAILATTNGGASWTSQSSGTAVQLLGVSCDLSGTRCFAVGPSTILLTTNSGATWSLLTALPRSSALNGISCPATIGFPVAVCFAESGRGGQVFHTTDTGFIWSTETTPSNGPLGAISCATQSNCLAVGNDFFNSRDSVVVTTNGGNAWSLLTVDHFAHLNSVSCVAFSSFCAAVGGSKNAFVTTNGGSSWISAPNGILSGEVGLNGVSCPSTTTCFAVGDKGAITKTTNGGVTWTRLQTSVTDDFLNLAGVSCPAEGTCFAVGGNGILVTTTGGAKWSKQLSGFSPQAISCPSTSDCFAVGTNLILATTNGGATWAKQTLPTTAGLDAISCPSTSVCFAGGTVMLATINGGGTWTRQPFFGGTVLGISCASTKTCVAVGFGGTISRTADGLHWTQETRVTTAGLHGVSCPTASDCIAVGDTGVILASTNGGVSWSFQTSTATSSFSSVNCLPSGFISSPPVCYVGTSIGEIFSGAGTWKRETQVEPFGPLALSCAGVTGFPANYQCMAVGDSGAIVSKMFSSRLGTGQLTPSHGGTEVGEETSFDLTWTVPTGKVWRDLDHLDLTLTDASGAIGLFARFYVGNPSTFAVLDTDGNIAGEGVPGGAGTIETSTFVLDLAKSSFLGTGPAGPSVTIDFVVSFKQAAAGNDQSPNAARVYQVGISAADLATGEVQSDNVGSWAVRPSH